MILSFYYYVEFTQVCSSGSTKEASEKREKMSFFEVMRDRALKKMELKKKELELAKKGVSQTEIDRILAKTRANIEKQQNNKDKQVIMFFLLQPCTHWRGSISGANKPILIRRLLLMIVFQDMSDLAETLMSWSKKKKKGPNWKRMGFVAAALFGEPLTLCFPFFFVFVLCMQVMV